MTSFLRLLLTAGLAFSVSLSAAGPSGSERWQVDTVTGQVTVSAAQQAPGRALASGESLQAPFTVTTGTDGQATLSRRGDRVSVGPDSSTRVLSDRRQDAGATTRVEQSKGSVLYRVRTRQKDRFEVQTPFLVSVVKGTTFNVNTDASGSTVALMEGSVLVQSLDGAESLLLQPGQAAARSALESQLRLHDPQSMRAPANGKVTVLSNGRGASDDAVVLRAAPVAADAAAIPARAAGVVAEDAAAGVTVDGVHAAAVDVPAMDLGTGVGNGLDVGGGVGGAAVDLGNGVGAADPMVGMGAEVDLGGAAAAANNSVSAAVDAAAGAVARELPDLSTAVKSPTAEIDEVLRKVREVDDDDRDDDLDDLVKQKKNKNKDDDD